MPKTKTECFPSTNGSKTLADSPLPARLQNTTTVSDVFIVCSFVLYRQTHLAQICDVQFTAGQVLTQSWPLILSRQKKTPMLRNV